MTGTIDTVVGLDIGTTASKALIRQLGHPSALIVQQPTRWRAEPGARTQLEASAFLQLAVDLIGAAVRAAESAWGRITIRAVSVGGIGESGVLLDPAGRPATPAIAWFDHRGDADVARVRRQYPAFVERFPGVTGLPWTFQATIAKLLCLPHERPIAPGSTWLSVPEWVVHGLGGDRCREPSLASRTGLIDQGTGQPWADALAIADLPDSFLPDQIRAGRSAGFLRHHDIPACAAGAVLSVAGHDHPVAALGVGAIGPDDLFNSSGTADVVARAVPGVLDESQRGRIVAARWSAGQHVVPGTTFLLAGVSGGLLLRRVLAALGAENPQAREALDVASCDVSTLPAGLAVEGDGRTDEDVVIRVQDGATPAAIWTAATRHTARLTRKLLDDIEPIVGPHRAALAAGGWTRMRSVRIAKANAIDRLGFSIEEEPGAVGAALLAEYSLMPDAPTPSDFLQHARSRTPEPIAR
ncbi:MAG TPA: FGGY family carbohydrate kinase [Actinoplanes sp.]|jgi:sugar (pentulose or hexulose) kinase|nr:FGGY family carbohydrate kinase [Actinoplanes sp.]